MFHLNEISADSVFIIMCNYTKSRQYTLQEEHSVLTGQYIVL